MKEHVGISKLKSTQTRLEWYLQLHGIWENVRYYFTSDYSDYIHVDVSQNDFKI